MSGFKHKSIQNWEARKCLEEIWNEDHSEFESKREMEQTHTGNGNMHTVC
jgi:hypothetical protein